MTKTAALSTPNTSPLFLPRIPAKRYISKTPHTYWTPKPTHRNQHRRRKRPHDMLQNQGQKNINIPKAVTYRSAWADSYTVKAIKSGDLLELITYDRPQTRRYFRKKPNRDTYKTNSSTPRRMDNQKRTKQKLVRKVQANYKHHDTRFLTFTYARNMYDRREAIADFYNAIRQFEKRTGLKLSYIYTMEKQLKRQQKYNLPQAPWHIHAVIFNAPYMTNEKWKQVFWNHGFVVAKKINNAQHCAFYIAKYITKDLITAKDIRSYTCSTNLNPPVESISADWINEQVQQAIDKGYKVYRSKPYSNPFTHNILTYVTLSPPD